LCPPLAHDAHRVPVHWRQCPGHSCSAAQPARHGQAHQGQPLLSRHLRGHRLRHHRRHRLHVAPRLAHVPARHPGRSARVRRLYRHAEAQVY